MHRFYVPGPLAEGEEISLPEDVARQARSVLRLTPGDRIAVFDGSGREWTAAVSSVSRREVRAALLEGSEPRTEPETEVALLVGIGRPEPFELVLQKGTELGAGLFQPVVSERVQGGSAARPSERRLGRWRKIVVEAAEQSGRVRVPEILEPAALPDAIGAAAEPGPVVLLWEGEREAKLQTVMSGLAGGEKKPGRLALVIGPVGGFTESEVESARRAGALVAGIGKRVLRTETVAIAALAVAMYELGELEG